VRLRFSAFPGHVILRFRALESGAMRPDSGGVMLSSDTSLHSEEVGVRADGTGRPAGLVRPQPALRIVRITRPEDVARAVGIAREYHGESRYGHIPFSEAKVQRVYGRLVARSDTTLAVLVEHGDAIVGVMLAEIGEYFLGTGGKIATNQVLYVSGRIRGTALGGRVALKLMRLFIDWAKSRGADEINVHATSGIEPERTDKFLKRLGLTPYGGSYAARLGN